MYLFFPSNLQLYSKITRKIGCSLPIYNIDRYEELRSYSMIYLEEEIRKEAIVRSQTNSIIYGLIIPVFACVIASPSAAYTFS